MFLRTELDNPNCEWVDGRVFQERSGSRPVAQALRRYGQGEIWCEVVGLDAGSVILPAMGRRVDDSGDGTCWLVFGGEWGLRLREAGSDEAWSVENPRQWGEAFLLLPGDGADLRFI